MYLKLYELANKKNACSVMREIDYDFQGPVQDHMEKAAIITRGIVKHMAGDPETVDLEAYIDENFKTLGYRSEKQRRIQAADAYRQMKRYLDCETRTGYPCKALDVRIHPDLVVNVRPHLVFYGKTPDGTDTIEVVRFKCKKPDITQRSVNRNLEIYALLKYGELLATTKTIITASVYFLRKQDDSNSEEKESFNLDFFNTRGGRNIVSLVEDYDGVSRADKTFKDQIDKFIAGYDESECTEADCKNCDFMPVCKFSNPPMSIPVTKGTRVAAGVKLTPEQREAKEYNSGIVRINAGAGAGKTLVVTLRVISLLNKGIKPEEILMITFTNAAAQEMRERIASLAEDDGIAEEVDISKIRISTFNAFGDGIVKEKYKSFGFPEEPHLIDDVERSKIVSSLLMGKEIDGLDYRNFEMNEPTVKGAVATASRAFEIFKKNPHLGLGDINTLYEKMDNFKGYCTLPAFMELYRLYSDYDTLLRDNGMMEFSDQENLIFELLGQEPYYFEKFGIKHIIVDEFQDTSETQIQIIKRMTDCPSFKSLMVVGDDSQSIYSFRDTTPYYIIHFDEVMGCHVDDIQLLENHRSTPEIIDFANKINAFNKERIIKDLIATRPHGKPVTVKGFLNSADEQAYVVDKVKELIDGGRKAEEIAILARNKSELNKIADLLAEKDIPSVVQFPERLTEDSRVIAALAMLNAIREPGDTKDLLVYANAIHVAETGETLKNVSEEELKKACEEALVRIRAYQAVTDEEEKKEALETLLKELDAEDSLYESFMESLLLRSSDKVFEYADDFSVFGKNVALKRTGNYPGVVLSTAHSSKGLEWPVCFNMIGGYDKKELHGTYTKRRCERIEEERRLLFVSSTRARDELYITAQYTCGGKAGEYIYNRYLKECFDVNGQEWSIDKIELERFERKQIEKERKKAEKEQKEEKNAS